MIFRGFPMLAVITLLACNPVSDDGASKTEPEVRDFNVQIIASGAAVNPCLESPDLSGFWIALTAKKDAAGLNLDNAGTVALDSKGKSWKAKSFIPKSPYGHEMERSGSMMVCGGSGGIKIDGSDETWGSVSESNLTFPPSGEGEPLNRIAYKFRKDGGLALGLFFAAPFAEIEAIELSNGQRIEREVWQRP
ncbi:hypothetical protein SAMN02745824_2081 [Parasphingorhabdus marina DSM 22363]|uniref:Uncharacterized protein n=1 Tax=Parasphingorhabdus marina DSM 22363 TaxID=1123272 RepID=A0A1N6ETN8_9SPHN|nr:hypothetical protein [Parasphingorhabdus marina]SIN86321.1 hypothetical protein SAMN02745824_2081 [Parasphingorhabdus marina DSM 22363]